MSPDLAASPALLIKTESCFSLTFQEVRSSVSPGNLFFFSLTRGSGVGTQPLYWTSRHVRSLVQHTLIHACS